MRDYREWYGQVYPRLVGHGLWLRGDEPHSLPERGFHSAAYRVLFARLSTWEDTVESFTHRLLYQVARSVEGIYPDYAFLPPRADLQHFEAGHIPWLLGVHSLVGARDFDLVGVSNSIVQELVNLPTLLEKSGIPTGKRERMERDDVPLVVLGGANAIHTSLLFVPDPPVDVVFAGESVEQIARLLDVCRRSRQRGASKAEVIGELEAIDGCIQPDRPRMTRKVFAKNPGSAALMARAPIPLHPDRIGTGVLQISEGCQSFCSFCSESYVRKPYREEPLATLLATAREMKRAAGLDKIDLFSFNFASYRDFYPLVSELIGTFPEIGLKSQRMDTVATDGNLLPLMHVLGKSKLTFGVEGVSARLRRYLHKTLDDALILQSFELIAASPVRELKLFYILTGLETEADFDELSALATRLRKVFERAGRMPRMVFSATPLVRFPWTPLEWEAAPTRQEVAQLGTQFERAVHRAGFEARLAASPEEYWISQVIARARDPRVLLALEQARRATGFLYYMDMTSRFVSAFRAAAVAHGLDPDRLVDPLPLDDESAPWVQLGSGLRRDYLRHKAGEARDYRESAFRPPLRKADTVRGPAQRPIHLRIREKLQARRKEQVVLPLHVELAPQMAGLPRSLAGALIASAMLQQWEDLTDDYEGYGTGLWDADWPCPTVVGIDVLHLKWTAKGAAAVRERLGSPQALADLNTLLAPRLSLPSDCLAPEPALLQVECRSPFPFNGAAYCVANHLKHTLRKPTAERAVYDFTPQVRKKAPVKELTAETGEGRTTVVTLRVTRGFDLRTFLRTAFDLPHPEDWVRVSTRVASDKGVKP